MESKTKFLVVANRFACPVYVNDYGHTKEGFMKSVIVSSLNIVSVAVLFFVLSTYSAADEQVEYAPAKVVYDISTGDPKALAHIFDRVSLLQNIYQNDPFEASIVLVIHEEAIPLFGSNDRNKHIELMLRARSLSLGEIIKFRVCKASANMQGYKRSDIQEFVSMVPMADAEIIRLQREGCAYLR